jgi:hypothetical protein
MAEKKNKQVRGFSLKPENINWLAEQALEKSTAEKKISDSAFLDQVLDQLREQGQSPTRSKGKKNAAPDMVAA